MAIPNNPDASIADLQRLMKEAASRLEEINQEVKDAMTRMAKQTDATRTTRMDVSTTSMRRLEQAIDKAVSAELSKQYSGKPVRTAKVNPSDEHQPTAGIDEAKRAEIAQRVNAKYPNTPPSYRQQMIDKEIAKLSGTIAEPDPASLAQAADTVSKKYSAFTPTQKQTLVTQEAQRIKQSRTRRNKK